MYIQNDMDYLKEIKKVAWGIDLSVGCWLDEGC